MKIPAIDIESCTAGTIHYPPGGKYGPRLYSEIQLVLLHSGSIRIEVNGERSLMLPGYVMLLLPDQWVSISFDEKVETWHRWITVTPRDGKSAELESLTGLPSVIPISEQMNRLVDLSIRQHSQTVSEHRTVLHTLAQAAIELYAADCLRNDSTGSHSVVLKVKSYIFDHYHEDLSLSDLANHANISHSHLVRLFRQYERVSPIQYLWRYRLERGLDLLTTSGLSIGEVASRCGFKTSYHFARLIKQYTKNTPTEIRLGHWQGR